MFYNKYFEAYINLTNNTVLIRKYFGDNRYGRTPAFTKKEIYELQYRGFNILITGRKLREANKILPPPLNIRDCSETGQG